MNTGRLDQEIRREIELGMRFVPGLDPADLGVSSDSGSVTLTGKVANVHVSLEVAQMARRVRGVHAVANHIQVRPKSPSVQPEAGLARAMEDAFGHGHRVND